MPPHKGLMPPEPWSTVRPRRGLQPRRETQYCKCNPRYTLSCLSLSPAVRLKVEMAIQTEGRRLPLSHKSPPLSYLFSWLCWFFWSVRFVTQSCRRVVTDYSVAVVAGAGVIGASCVGVRKRVVSNHSRKLPGQKPQCLENKFLISENIYH